MPSPTLSDGKGIKYMLHELFNTTVGTGTEIEYKQVILYSIWYTTAMLR